MPKKTTKKSKSTDPTQLSPEEQFEALKAAVDAKLAEAADMIREAAKMAKAGGFSLHGTGEDEDEDEEGDDESLFNLDCIEDAMDDAGWRTSTWHC